MVWKHSCQFDLLHVSQGSWTLGKPWFDFFEQVCCRQFKRNRIDNMLLQKNMHHCVASIWLPESCSRLPWILFCQAKPVLQTFTYWSQQCASQNHPDIPITQLQPYCIYFHFPPSVWFQFGVVILIWDWRISNQCPAETLLQCKQVETACEWTPQIVFKGKHPIASTLVFICSHEAQYH